MWLITLSILSVVHSVLSEDVFLLSTFKRQEGCDLWAQRDGECVNNPRYMWGACAGSCLSPALNGNRHSECDQWADEGECVNNPSYLHINCAHSCGDAIAWSPWVRRDFAVDESHIHDTMQPSWGEDEIQVPHNVFDASLIVNQRLRKYVLGGLHSVVSGLSSSAPTEYLGMLGLAEAVLYAMRMQELAMEFSQTSETILSGHREVINEVLDQIAVGYTPDLLYRPMHRWIDSLDRSEKEIMRHLAHVQESNMHMDMSFSRLAEQFAHSVHVDFELSPRSIFVQSQSDKDSLLLNNGIKMPRMGLGTWQLEREQCEEAVLQAVRTGYRFLDTAQAYGNEDAIGRALHRAINVEHLVNRSQLFVATKISDERDFGRAGFNRLFASQLKALQVDYIDLYMLHSPIGNQRLLHETWAAMEALVDAGKIRALGVSNYDSSELQSLLANARIPPAVVQNKIDIYHVGKQLDDRGVNNLQFFMTHDIVPLAYSPFSAYPFSMLPQRDPIVAYLVNRRNEQGEQVTAGQLLLQWMNQRGMAMIPRSADPERQKENLLALTVRPLSREEMTLLDLCQVLIGHPHARAIEMPTFGLTA